MSLQTSSKHGSGENDDVDLNLSPARSTLSTTVSFPPGSQQGPGFHIERNPLLESVGPLEEALLPVVTSLENATQEELIWYLESNRVVAEACDQVSQHRLTGRHWIGMYGQGEAAAAVAMMMSDFPALQSLRARVLVLDAQDALKRKEVAAEVDYTAKLAVAKVSPAKPQVQEQYSKKHKVETAPKLGTPANKHMYTSSEMSTIFSKLGLWLGPKSDGLAKGLHKIQHETLIGQCDVSALRVALPERCSTLDEELAAELVSHLPKCLEAEIVKIRSNHMIDGKASSLRIMQALKNRVERKTKSRGSALLYKLMGRKPCKAKQELQGELFVLSEEYEQLERMGCTPADQDAIMHPALVRVMSVLEQDDSVGATVLAKMAAVEQADPGDSKALRDVLDLLAAEWAVDYADLQGPTVKHHDKLFPGQLHRSNVTTQGADHGVMAAGPFNTPCFAYREQGQCHLKDLECPHVHEGRTGVQCTNDEFVQKGLCSNFKRCLSEHKYDEGKFGKIKNAIDKYPGASPERMALKFSDVM
jgi:hypothetical protein